MSAIWLMSDLFFMTAGRLFLLFLLGRLGIYFNRFLRDRSQSPLAAESVSSTPSLQTGWSSIQIFWTSRTQFLKYDCINNDDIPSVASIFITTLVNEMCFVFVHSESVLLVDEIVCFHSFQWLNLPVQITLELWDGPFDFADARATLQLKMFVFRSLIQKTGQKSTPQIWGYETEGCASRT